VPQTVTSERNFPGLFTGGDPGDLPPGAHVVEQNSDLWRIGVWGIRPGLSGTGVTGTASVLLLEPFKGRDGREWLLASDDAGNLLALNGVTKSW